MVSPPLVTPLKWNQISGNPQKHKISTAVDSSVYDDDMPYRKRELHDDVGLLCGRSFSLTRKGDLVNDGDEMVVLPTSPTSSVPGGDTCVTGACLERRLSLRTYKLSKLLVFPRIQSGGDVRNTGACLEQNTSRWWCFQPSKLSRAWKIV